VAAVAPLKGDCVVCQQPEKVRLAVNTAIWPDGERRARTYRAKGAAAYVAMTGERINVKTVTRHAEHVESTRRAVTRDTPMDEDRHERPVVATDFFSVADKASRVGMLALERMEQFLEGTEPVAVKDAIAIARLGVAASAKGEDSRLKRGDQAIELMAVFASVSGFVPDVGNVPRNVTPVGDMKAAVVNERRRLMARAGWTDDLPDDLP
jgi:hypothetical protein